MDRWGRQLRGLAVIEPRAAFVPWAIAAILAFAAGLLAGWFADPATVGLMQAIGFGVSIALFALGAWLTYRRRGRR